MSAVPDVLTEQIRAQFDNPIWHALRGPHAHLAQGGGQLRWYPQSIAPFFAVATPDSVITTEDFAGVEQAPDAYFVGASPSAVPPRWRLGRVVNVLQMLYPSDAVPQVAAGEYRTLTPADSSSMQALAKIAFPAFFRSRTRELGTYVGHFANGELVSMAGERLALEGFREISGVCTHPDHVGRGHAQRLTQVLLDQHRKLRLRSFLHVSEANSRARGIYESMGFVIRATLSMKKLEKAAAE